MCAWVSLLSHMYERAQGDQRRVLDPLKLGLQEVVSFLTWVLETGPRSSARVVRWLILVVNMTPGKRDSQLKNYLYQIGPWAAF